MKRALVLVAALAGCEDFGRLQTLKPRRMEVRLTDISILPDAGQVERPRPIERAGRCEVAVDGLLNAGWQVVYGTWVRDGVCELREVQPGETYVRVPGKNLYFATTLDTLDLGNDDVGRPFTSAGEGTTVTLDVTGADPFGEPTELSLYVPDFGNGFTGSGVTVQAMRGQTAFAAVYDWQNLPLLEAGEEIDLFQARTTWDGGSEVHVALSRKGVTSVTVVDTRNVRAPVQLMPLTTPAATPLPPASVDPAPLLAQLREVYPEADFLGTWLLHEVRPEGFFLPLGVQHKFSVAEGRLLSLPAYPFDPLPGLRWRGVLSLSAYVERRFTEPAPGGAVVGITVHGPVDDLTWLSSTAISPVKGLGVRDRDGRLQVDGELDTTTPVLAWNAPEVGRANLYNVGGYRVDVSGGAATLRALGVRLLVQNPEAHIPPEVLQQGQSYVFDVLAENCTASDPKRPRRTNPQLPCAIAQSVSRVFTVR